MNTKNSEMKSFEDHYWKTYYSKPKEMDAIGNKREHCNYLSAVFRLEQVEIDSIIDFGMGLGLFFDALLKKFKPYHAVGMEPSKVAFGKAKEAITAPSSNMKLALYNEDIESFLTKKKKATQVFDLGICTSVFQYLSEKELEVIIPEMAKKVRYLYLTVPTDLEFKRLKEDIDFTDSYAHSRSQEFYLALLRPHFTFISNRILESRVHYGPMNSEFRELLYRF